MNERLKNVEILESYTLRDGTSGITLVALMVTIIVLLILAMVSVSLVLRGNIIEKANLAATKYGTAAEEENTDLDKFEEEINKYIPGDNSQKDGKSQYYLNLLAKCYEEGSNVPELDQLTEEGNTYQFFVGEDICYFYVDGYAYKYDFMTEGSEVELTNNEEETKIKTLVKECKECEEDLKNLLVGKEYECNTTEDLATYIYDNLGFEANISLNGSANESINIEITKDFINDKKTYFDYEAENTAGRSKIKTGTKFRTRSAELH